MAVGKSQEESQEDIGPGVPPKETSPVGRVEPGTSRISLRDACIVYPETYILIDCLFDPVSISVSDIL